MSEKIPFAVLAIHPGSGLEILSILAQTHRDAMNTAAHLCVERGQPDLSIVAAFSLGEIDNIKRVLERAAYIGSGNGHKPSQEMGEEGFLDEDPNGFEDNDFNDPFESLYENENESSDPTTNQGPPAVHPYFGSAEDTSTKHQEETYHNRRYKNQKKPPPQPKQQINQQSSDRLTVGSVSAKQEEMMQVHQQMSQPKQATDDNILHELDLSEGKKETADKSNVFLDDYYDQ